METKSLTDLIEYLCRPGQRVRTGIWLVHDEHIGKEIEIAQNLRRTCDTVDLRQAVLARRPSATEYSGIKVENIQTWLDDILEKDVLTDCVILSHFDLLLAYLPAVERTRAWDMVQISFVRRGKALIIAFPKRAVGLLLREKTLEEWHSEGRIAGIENSI